jgi:hypothetical protein
MQTRIGALRSNRRHVVVTMLTCKLSLTSPLVPNMVAFGGKVTPSIVRAWTCDRAELTRRNGV